MEQLIYHDVDGDSKNELVVKVKWFNWHQAEGIKGDFFEVYVYDDAIDTSSEGLLGLKQLKTIDMGIVGGFDGMSECEYSRYKYKSN